MATSKYHNNKRRKPWIIDSDDETTYDNKTDYGLQESLGHVTNLKFLLYLVFSYILSQDVSSLHILLEEVRYLQISDISLEDIYDVETSIINGILSNEELRYK